MFFIVLIILQRPEFLYIRIIISDKSRARFARKIASQSQYKNQNRDSDDCQRFFFCKPHTNTKGGQKSVYTKQRHIGNIYAH
jgi:hypothetical protein